MSPDSHTPFLILVSSFFPYFVSLEICLLFRVFLYHHCRFLFILLYGEYVVRFPLPDGIFLPCDYGLDFFTSAYVRIQSINSINQSLQCIKSCTRTLVKTRERQAVKRETRRTRKTEKHARDQIKLFCNNIYRNQPRRQTAIPTPHIIYIHKHAKRLAVLQVMGQNNWRVKSAPR